MTHDEVYKQFESHFPERYLSVKAFFPNGKNSVRIRPSNSGEDYIFTYEGEDDWKFETVDSFIKTM